LKTVYKILDYFFLLRPTLFFPLWTALLAGRFNSPGYTPIGWVTLFLGILLGVSYILNQIADIEGDRSNKKLFLMADNYVSVKAAMIYAAALTLAGLGGFFFLGLIYGIAGVIFLFVTGYMYNFQPFRWKDNPYWGPLVTVFAGAMAFIFGALPDLDGLIWKSVLPYMAAFGAVALLTTVLDISGDVEAGKKTFAVAFGGGKAAVTAAALCAISALAAYNNKDWIIFWPALVSTPVYIYTAFKPVNKHIVLSIKLSIFSLSAAVGLIFPWYLLLMAGYYSFARAYYKSRFNLEYPSFKLE